MRDILEILFFISGIVVALAALVALYQLILTKRLNQLNAKRAACSLAIERCQFYLTQVIALLDALDNKLKESGIRSFGTTKIHIEKGAVRFSIKLQTLNNEQILAMARSLQVACNALESFSVSFISGAAAKSVAFSTVGWTFCSSVELLLPHIVPLSQSGNYQNTAKLFVLWYPRLKKHELEQKKQLLQQESDEIRDVSITAIGT